MKRVDGREPSELRPVKIQTGFQRNAEGSALITVGGTTVLCAASVEEKVPSFCATPAGLGDGRVRDVAARDQHAHAARVRVPEIGGARTEIQR